METGTVFDVLAHDGGEKTVEVVVVGLMDAYGYWKVVDGELVKVELAEPHGVFFGGEDDAALRKGEKGFLYVVDVLWGEGIVVREGEVLDLVFRG